MVAAADLVLTATVEVRRQVLEDSPGALRRTFTLREFAALIADDTGVGDAVRARGLGGAVAARTRGGLDLDIADPMGMGPEVHADVLPT